MGLLSEEFTEQDKSFEFTHGTDIKPFKRGAVADITLGAVSGVGKGVISVSNGLTRFVEGDEVADKRMQQANEALTPKNQSTAGHITSGITEIVSSGLVGSPLGPLGIAGAVGIGSRASEHTRLTQQLGVDAETADTASNIYGATNAVLAGLPVANVFRTSMALDYSALVVAPTIVGQGTTYLEGDVLEANGYQKQAQMYKEMATDPKMIAMNLGIGSAFFALGRVRADPHATQEQVHAAEAKTYDAVDQAIAEADLQSSPTKPDSIADTFQHEANLNQAIDQVIKGEKVNLSEATSGQLKSLDDVKNYIQNKNIINNSSTNTAKNESQSLAPQTTLPPLNIKAEISKDQNVRVKDSYQAAQQAGFSPAQAKALVGELGRENDFNINTMFGFHTDAANHKRNGGIFSWQDAVSGKGRATNLYNHMNSKGLVNADGTFKRTNEALVEQFSFLKKEIESNPKWKQTFLDKKNITNEEARSALGGKGTIIGWARGQSILKSGKAFDWQAHEARANKYSNMVDGEPITTHVENGAELIPLARNDLSSLDATVHRTDLDSFPKIDEDFISPHDIDAFEARNKINDDLLAGDQSLSAIKRLDHNELSKHLEVEQFSKGSDRRIEEQAYGYLSQIPKGQEAITKLKDNPNLIISSKKTGEDLTAQQWQQKLQQEHGNIQMMNKAMSTLAKCSFKQIA